MQRLFVMFPDRAPGVGLLLLRLGLAIALCRAGWPPAAWPAALAVAGAGLLLCGWLTPLAAALAWLALLLEGPPTWPWLCVPLALLLLGPGAYSLDARRFGRRVLRHGPPRHPPKE